MSTSRGHRAHAPVARRADGAASSAPGRFASPRNQEERMFGRTFHGVIMLLSLRALSGVAFAAAPPAVQPVPHANQAMVRVLHAAPTAAVARIVLTSAEQS